MPKKLGPFWKLRRNIFTEINNFKKESPKLFYSLMMFLPWPFVFTFYDWHQRRFTPFLNFASTMSTKFLKDKFKTSVDDLFSSNEIVKSADYFVDNVFNHQVKEDIIDAVLLVVRSDDFLDSTKDWSKDWILKIFRSQEFKQIAKANTLAIIKAERVKSEGGDFVKELVTDEVFKDFIGDIMKEIWLRDDVLGDLTGLFQRCGVRALTSEKIKLKASEMFMKIWSDNNFKSFIFDQSLSFWAEAEIDKFQPSMNTTPSKEGEKENPYDAILKRIVKSPKV
jgi:hypothetical protein